MPEGIIIFGSAGSPCMKTHKEWADSLPCKVIRLNGEEELNKSAEIIVREFFLILKCCR